MCKNLVSSLLANNLLMGRNFDSIMKNTAFVTNQHVYDLRIWYIDVDMYTLYNTKRLKIY